MQFEEHVWRKSFYFMIKYYSNELRAFQNVDSHMLELIQDNLKFRKYKPGSVIDFSLGGIFLKGKPIIWEY